jgi:hypothetical protein
VLNEPINFDRSSLCPHNRSQPIGRPKRSKSARSAALTGFFASQFCSRSLATFWPPWCLKTVLFVFIEQFRHLGLEVAITGRHLVFYSRDFHHCYSTRSAIEHRTETRHSSLRYGSSSERPNQPLVGIIFPPPLGYLFLRLYDSQNSSSDASASWYFRLDL